MFTKQTLKRWPKLFLITRILREYDIVRNKLAKAANYARYILLYVFKSLFNLIFLFIVEKDKNVKRILIPC